MACVLRLYIFISAFTNVLLFEIFEMTNECRRMIMSDAFDPGELKRAARRGGMSTLVEHALTLIEDGITTHAEIIRVLGENDL